MKKRVCRRFLGGETINAATGAYRNAGGACAQ